MKNLKLYDTAPIDKIALPVDKHEVNLQSSALLIFTDFHKTRPLVIESDVTVVELENIMRKAHVRMKIVLDANGAFQGIVSYEDILHRKVVQKVAEGFKREELLVSDFMRKKATLKAFSYNEVYNATIEDVINSLKNEEEQHCLVTGKENSVIRGVISASDIARKLHLDINILDNISFTKIFKKIS